jgi:hypothetical protein
VNDNELRSKARSALLNYLTKGEVETHTEITKDSLGRVISIKQKIINKPCPQWVINRTLGEFEEIQALKVLVEAGWLPDNLLNFTSEKFTTLTDEIKTLFESKELFED